MLATPTSNEPHNTMFTGARVQAGDAPDDSANEGGPASGNGAAAPADGAARSGQGGRESSPGAPDGGGLDLERALAGARAWQSRVLLGFSGSNIATAAGPGARARWCARLATGAFKGFIRVLHVALKVLRLPAGPEARSRWCARVSVKALTQIKSSCRWLYAAGRCACASLPTGSCGGLCIREKRSG